MKPQKQFYDNCEMYGPDNKLIGYCGKNRLEWYISKGIAEEIPGNNNAFKLKFKPKYRDNAASVRTKRENKCYVCSSTKELLKFHIIPTEYKRLFPQEWKRHNSIDVLPLCHECCRLANSYTCDLKNELAQDFDVWQEDYIDQEKTDLKKLSRKIKSNSKHSIDNTVLIDRLNSHLGHKATDEEINEYISCDTTLIYKGTKSPAEYIVNQIIEQEKIKEFIKRWKDNFVINMKPDDLPKDFYCYR